MHISEREQDLPDQLIEELLQISAERKDILSLGPGEPDFHLPTPLVSEIKKLANKVNHYAPPGGFLALRKAICKKLRKENKIAALPENVVVTSGSQEALMIATACTLDVSEEIVIPSPGYMSYLPTIELFNASPVFVELKEENNYEIDPDDICKVIRPKKTKVLIVNSPANPTGNVIRKKTFEQLADIAVEHDLYIFSDEAYEKIIYDGAKHVSPASLNGMGDYVVSFYTFSKTYAMCGFRLGYCVAPLSLAQAIKKTHVYTTICAPNISQLLGVKALSLPSKYTDAMVRSYKKRRDLLVPRLNELGLSTPMPKGAFYAFSNISQFAKNSKKFSLDLIKKASVATVPGTDFGAHGEGHVRFSYATDIKIIEKALDRIEKFLRAR